jgi:hypothetical protein
MWDAADRSLAQRFLYARKPLNWPARSVCGHRAPARVPNQTTHPKLRFLAGRGEGGVQPEQAKVRKASAPCEASSRRGRSFHIPRGRRESTATDS